jgi:hypothetical protein
MTDMTQLMMQRLAAQRASRKERSEALWKLSAEERVAAMRRGELTWGQLCEWANKARSEVPLLNGEYEFIAARSPEAAEAHERKR